MKPLDLESGAETIIQQISYTHKSWQEIRDCPDSYRFMSYHKQAKCLLIKHLILKYRKPDQDVEAAIRPFFKNQKE